MKTSMSMLRVVCCWCLCLSLCSFSLAENSTKEKPVENQPVHPETQMQMLKSIDNEITKDKKEAAVINKQKAKEIPVFNNNSVDSFEGHAPIMKINVGDALNQANSAKTSTEATNVENEPKVVAPAPFIKISPSSTLKLTS